VRRFRYAPTPSRLLHVGNGLAAAINWAAARAAGARFLLRIEDIDTTRCKPEYEQACLDDLEWLGIDWDEGPVRQSDRFELYDAMLSRLAEAGLTYACTCSRAEIRTAQRAPHLSPTQTHGETPYPGTCRTEHRAAPLSDRGGWRLDVEALGDDAIVAIDDRWQGSYVEDVRTTCGDFLLGRPGQPTYQLAAVYDDMVMGVTDVVRGHDLVGSSARQRLLHRALNRVGVTDDPVPEPTLAHHPLIVDDQGRKLSKRDRAMALSGLRADGVDPGHVLATTCASIGLVAPTIRSLRPADLVEVLGESSQSSPPWRDGPLLDGWSSA